MFPLIGLEIFINVTSYLKYSIVTSRPELKLADHILTPNNTVC